MSDEKVVPFTGISRIDQPADKILEQALAHGLENVVIVGYDKDGDEFFLSSYADGANVLWHFERAKYKLMQLTEEM